MGVFLMERGGKVRKDMVPPLDFDTLLFEIILENHDAPKSYTGFFSFAHGGC